MTTKTETELRKGCGKKVQYKDNYNDFRFFTCGTKKLCHLCELKEEYNLGKSDAKKEFLERINNFKKRLIEVGSDDGSGIKIIGVNNAIYELNKIFGENAEEKGE